MKFAGNYFDWQSVWWRRTWTARDRSGCGVGNFTRYLLDREFVVGIDSEPACAAKWQQAFPGKTNLLGTAMDVTDPNS